MLRTKMRNPALPYIRVSERPCSLNHKTGTMGGLPNGHHWPDPDPTHSSYGPHRKCSQHNHAPINILPAEGEPAYLSGDFSPTYSWYPRERMLIKTD
ncbi:hypothetical protein AVEN_199018-1 [Araneus ventricosus]|uniref:Uncharacterized protein n=1 Tax=Araneus ventricosus TaxID=182803 RepID=A0A4Y2QIL0_ARAVE|nr:hypothetical protein AVEN_199018-1 [Araneus ventricosus]